jgi:hypothetical protein
MTEVERQKMMSVIDLDIKAIEKNEEYLLKKFRKLSARGKEDVITQLNISLNSDLKYSKPQENDKKIRKLAVTEQLDWYELDKLIGKDQRDEIADYILELYNFEPKNRRRGNPRYPSSRYEKLSLFSKRKVIDRINSFLNPVSESGSKCVGYDRGCIGTDNIINLSRKTFKREV